METRLQGSRWLKYQFTRMGIETISHLKQMERSVISKMFHDERFWIFNASSKC